MAMKYMSTYLNRFALAAAALVMGVASQAQTAINNDYFWGGGATIPAFSSFDNDHIYRQGWQLSPNNSRQITVDGNNYATYDTRDASDEALKFVVAPGAGDVYLYYRDVAEETRNITRGLRVNDTNASLNGATTRNDDVVTFPEAWGGNGITWSFTAAEKVKVSSFTLNLPNNNIDGDIARVRIVFRFHDGVSEMDASTEYTAQAANQSITLNVDDDHRDAYLREIYIQNSSAGKVRVGTCTLQGTVTETPKLTRNITRSLTPTDDEVTFASGTTINGNSVVFNNGWTGFSWNFGVNSKIRLNNLSFNVNYDGIGTSERSPVRVVVRYVGHGVEEVSDAWDWETSYPNADKTSFTVTPVSGSADYYVREIYIQNSSSGRVNIGQVTLNGTEEITGQNVPTLRDQNRQLYNTGDPVTLNSTTKYIKYHFNSTDNTTFYAAGGYIGAIRVDMDETTIETAPNLRPITEDYLWYYNNGHGIWSKGYVNNNREFRYIPGDHLGVSNEKIYVNGKVLNGTEDTDNHSYLFADEAIGFKLDPSLSYRIRVFSTEDNPLHIGINGPTSAVIDGGYQAANSSKIKSVTVTGIKDAGGGATTTKLTTYEITGSGDTYWLRGQDMKLGGFEVLPIVNTNTNLATLPVIPAVATSWWVDDNYTTVNNQLTVGTNNPDVLPSGVSAQYFYVYGPTMPINDTRVERTSTKPNYNGRSVMLNDGNRIGFRVSAGSTVSFTIISDPGITVRITPVAEAVSLSPYTYTTENGWNTITYEAEYDETIWVNTNSHKYVYFQGLTVTPTEIANAPNPAKITDDFIFYPDGPIQTSSLFAGDYLANNGVAKLVNEDEATKVDGSMHGVFDYTRSSGSLRFTVDASVNTGEIRIIYKEAIPSIPEHLTNLNADYRWAADESTVGFSGQSITFTNNTSSTIYPGGGIALPASTGIYDRVTVNVENPNDMKWHIVVNYADGFDGASIYETSTSITASIDPTRVLTAIIIQPDLAAGQSKTVTITDVTLNRLGNSAGDKIAATLHQGSATGTEVGQTYDLEGSKVITYRFTGNSADTDYYVRGGFIASVQVFKHTSEGYNSANLEPLAVTDNAPYYWRPEDFFGATINNGSAKMVLNGAHWTDQKNTSYSGRAYIYGDYYYESSSDHFIVERDHALNTTKVNSNNTVMFSYMDAVGVKLPALAGGKKYKVTAYWQKVDGKGGLQVMERSDYARWPDASVVRESFTSTTPAEYIVDATTDKVIWIGGNGLDPIYFAGFKVEIAQDYGIVFDVDVPGIFTGSYRYAGKQARDNGELLFADEEKTIPVWDIEPDLENQLLIYCTDNGTYESFRMPIVNFHNAKTNEDTDITTAVTPAFSNIAKLNLPYATKVASGKSGNANLDPQAIVADGSLPVVDTENNTVTVKNVYRIQGFEDTDMDNLYRVEYTYTSDASGTSTEYKNHFYIWFANFLKVGWATNREAKLIVGTDKSSNDPDHIIVGEFYVGAGETGDFYYDVINPGQDVDGNTVPGYGNAVLTGAEWTFTTDNGGEGTGGRPFKPKERELKANKVDLEDFSWTKMNDHKSHLSDAISLAFPTTYNPAVWNNGEVVKTVSFRVKRGGGWPDWTAKLTFHFVPAPKIELQSTSTTHKEVKMSGYKGDYSKLNPNVPDNSATIYYTTDGTVPTFDAAGNPTNATYTYTGPVTNRKLAIYYAAERLKMPKKFYIHNPYTTYIEGKSMYDLMATYDNNGQLNANPNITDMFVSLSNEYEAPVADPLVEFLDDQRNVTKKDGTNNYVTTTSYNEWGEAEDSHSFSAVGAGGFLYKYPFNHMRRDMMVQFGNSTKRVYRNENDVNKFWNVGVYWQEDDNTSFKEHFESNIMQYFVTGQNYEGKYGKQPDALGQTTENGNPQTECNGGIGGKDTEMGGMFLQPITGDFLRLEPEYDGVITLWLRQNGAGQGSEENGDITRRPVYVVDENGVVMKRSTVKPSSDHYFGVDGFYAEICSHRSIIRHDFRNDWVNGLDHWKRGFKTADAFLPTRNMATFRLYNYWYGFPLYQNLNRLNHDNSDQPAQSTDFYRWTMDVPDSWVSRTTNVKSVQCDFNPILYHSEYIHSNVEERYTFLNEKGEKKKIDDGDKFAKYGWEIPAFNLVRYRIPVKAGKTYYIGGRGTKNGYMGAKFEPLPPNYRPSDYIHADNRLLREDSISATENALIAMPVPADKVGRLAGAEDNYDPAAMRALYADKKTYYVPGRENNNGTYTYRQYDIYAKDGDSHQEAGYGNYWYGSNQGQNGEGTANVLYQGYKTGKFDANHMDEFVEDNTVRGLSCDVKLHRTFTKNYWHPIVLPFSVSETRMKEIFGDDVQVLYLDPYDNTMPGVNVHRQGKQGVWNSALRPAIIESELKFTWHHYQMLYANTPAFICPGGRIKKARTHVEGENTVVDSYYWDSEWTTIDEPVFERVTVDRTNVFKNGNYEVDNRVCGYKIGDVGNYEYWVVGCYTPGMKGNDMYYLTNELATQNGESKVRATIYHSPNGKTMQATRCWIETRAKSGAGGLPPMLSTVGFGAFDDGELDETPTGIVDIVMDENEFGFSNGTMEYDDNVYDVLGRIVGFGTTDGLPSGVYIFHGKKIYVR